MQFVAIVDDKRLLSLWREFRTEGESAAEFLDRVIVEGMRYFEDLKEMGDDMAEKEGRS